MGWDAVGAAWVQAIGSIVAIFIAIFVGAAPVYAEHRRTVAKGRVVAFRLAPLLLTLHADVQRAFNAAAELESGTSDFNAALILTRAMIMPTSIPDEIFAETWSLPANVALTVANLENALREYQTASSELAFTGSVNVIPQGDRTRILTGMRGMLQRIDIFALAVSNYCTAIGKASAAGQSVTFSN